MIVTRRAARSLVILIASSAAAQQTRPTLDEVLARVHANVTEYRQSVPNFAVDESRTSYIDDHSRIKDRVRVDSSFRVTRGTTRLEETREMRAVNSKRPKKRKPYLPYTYGGAFADGTGFLLDKCDDFKLARPDSSDAGHIVILFERAPRPSSSPQCNGLSYHGKARIDPVSFNVEGIEMEVVDTPFGVEHNSSINIRISDHNTTMTSVNYSPVTLGDRTFWLPQRVTSTLTDNTKPLSLHYESTYSNYKLFTSTVTVTPVGPTE